MTPEELEKLATMRRGLHILAGALIEVEQKYQDDVSVRYAVAERGRLVILALTELCEILEGKLDEGADYRRR